MPDEILFTNAADKIINAARYNKLKNKFDTTEETMKAREYGKAILDIFVRHDVPYEKALNIINELAQLNRGYNNKPPID